MKHDQPQPGTTDEREPQAMVLLSVTEISVMAQLVMRAPNNIEGLTEDVAIRILEKLRHAEPIS